MVQQTEKQAIEQVRQTKSQSLKIWGSPTNPLETYLVLPDGKEHPPRINLAWDTPLGPAFRTALRTPAAPLLLRGRPAP